MRWGALLEPVIFAALEQDGYPVTPGNVVLTDPAREWLAGTPDGYTVLGEGLATEEALLEVKTTNGWAHRAHDGPPMQNVAQMQHYFHLTGLKRGLLALLVNGQHLETHEVVRNDMAISLLLDAAERMHWHVVTDTQPAVGPSDSDREALAALYPEAREARRVRLDKEGMLDVANLRARKAQAAAVAEQVQALENRLKARMGDSEVAISPTDSEVLRWANVTSRRLDGTRLKAERPEIAETFTVPTTSRRFTVV